MNDKLCVILNIAPHYRKAIYKAIDEAFDCDWYVGDRVDDIISLLTFFVLSMYSEGYIFAGGSSLCLILGLTLGCCLTINKIDLKP